MSEELLEIMESISIDETPGVQADKDEIAVEEDWAAQLAALFPGYDFSKPANLSHKEGMISTPDGFSTIGWADEEGASLDGVESNLMALDPDTGEYEKVILSTEDDGKVLIGTTESGNVAFIAVIVPSEDGLSSDVYLLGYLPMEHEDSSNPDDFVALTGLYVHVTVEGTLDFEFDGAPSGNNDFMAFGEPDGVAIVVTGRTEGETVNSSKAGSQPTSLAANSNNINAGEGLVITYVFGMDQNFLVPNLTGPEASDTANIQFEALHTSTEGSVTIVKVGPGNTTATVHITALHTDKELGTTFIPGIANDAVVEITAVYVNGIQVDLVKLPDSETVVITGIKNNDVITFETDGEHNRFVVENGGTGNARFSLGGVSIAGTEEQSDAALAMLLFYDDGPTAATATPEEEVTLVVDESPLPDDGDGIRTASGDFTVYFASGSDADYGSDGPGSESYALVLTGTGVGSGLFAVDATQADGKGSEILLTQNGAVIEGKVGDQVYFTISVDNDPESPTFGHVTFTQTVEEGVSIWHSQADDHDDSEELIVDPGEGEEPNSLKLVQTLTDADLDSDTAEKDLGSGVFFVEDDGPTAATETPEEEVTLVVDESPLPDDGDGIRTASGDFTVYFASGSDADYGSDGPGSESYALVLTGTGVGSGLFAVDATQADGKGSEILLTQNGAVIEGKVGDQVYFTISVDNDPESATFGHVTFTQTVEEGVSIWHSQTDDHDDSEELIVDPGEGEEPNSLKLVQTLTDADLDSDTAEKDLGSGVFFVEDDGPTIAVDDASGTYSESDPAEATGDFVGGAGADGLADLAITFDSYKIDDNPLIPTSGANVTFVESITDTRWVGTIHDDFNGDGESETIEFTLDIDLDSDTYTVTLDTPPSQRVELSTADGSLDAGGPDPVRTLTLADSSQVVFSAVNPMTDASEISDFLDKSEAEIEAGATYLSDDQINVSTAGIGNGNNNFDGNADSGVDGNVTKGGKVDESFVVDPSGFLVSSVKVYIDNSVGGYNTTSEELYYRVYYADGTVGELTLVTDSHLSSEAGGQVSFTIGDPEGPNNIDAVQLFMGTGTIKIPVIEFTTSEQFDPDSLELNFTATLKDGDGDTATDTFSVDFDEGAAMELDASSMDFDSLL